MNALSLFLAQFYKILGANFVRRAAAREVFVPRVIQIELSSDDRFFFQAGASSRKLHVSQVPVRPKTPPPPGKKFLLLNN